jgi:hypothetical protein
MYFTWTSTSSTNPTWRRIWHDGNDGIGSGLNADMLDGKHASEFALKGEGGTTIDGLSAAQFLRSDVDDAYTGDTLTIKGGKIRVRDDFSPSLYFDLYTEENTTKLADEFGGNTDKKFIHFSTGSGGGNDSGFIAHETNAPSSNSAADKNRGVLHLCPSDDNAYGDYVSIHGTNDPDKLQLHTDGTIQNLGSRLRLCGGTDTNKTDVRIGTSGNGYKVWHEGNDGTDSGLDADKLDGKDASDFILKSDGGYYIQSSAAYVGSFTNIVGQFNNSRNYIDVFPPTGYTMSDLCAFIPSIHVIHFAGGVNGDDSFRCAASYKSDRIRVYVQNTEQRSKAAANWLAVWKLK